MNPFDTVASFFSRRKRSGAQDIPPLPPARSGFWARLGATPVGDLLAGRLSASLDAQRAIASAGLPEPLAGLAYQAACRKAWFTRSRYQVARQIVAHFELGLAAGRTPASLADAYISLDQFPASAQQAPLVATADLPLELAELVNRVVHRARLWPSERRDVCQELAGHFRDGLASGASPVDLIAGFGDSRQASKLIRRAKLRNRPRFYRALRRARQAMLFTIGATLVAYLFLAARMHLTSPSISHNYVAEINAAPQSLAPDERAWPLYREALLSLPKDLPSPDDIAAGPKGEGWPKIAQYLEQNQAALELGQQAAKKPRLGFVYGDPDNRKFLTRFASGPNAHGESPDRYQPELIALLLPHVQEFRRMAQLYQMDALQAASTSDGPRFVTDIESLLALSRHVNDAGPFLIVALVAAAVHAQATDLIGATLAEQAAVLTDDDLKRLAHALAGHGGRDSLPFHIDGERMMFDDVLQRTFSDNGNGDGHLTAGGLVKLMQYASPTGMTGPPEESAIWLWGPVLSAAVAGRQDMHDLANHWFDRCEADRGRPLWQWQGTLDMELKRIAGDRLSRVRYFPIVLLMPASLSAFLAREIRAQEHDATLAAIALELHRRRTGAWPSTLDELTPGLLPHLPADVFTGGPLRYRLKDDRPLLYSRGADCDDDGGTPPLMGNQVARQWQPEAKLDAATVTTTWATQHDGDWILWPPLADSPP